MTNTEQVIPEKKLRAELLDEVDEVGEVGKGSYAHEAPFKNLHIGDDSNLNKVEEG